MTQKWNLQDIRPAQPKKRREVSSMETVTFERPAAVARDDAEETLSLHIVDGNKKKSRTLLYAVLLFFVVVAGGVVASALLGGAEVTVYPKHREPNVNALFKASKATQAGELTYEVMTLDAQGERQVKASGEEQITAQAKGSIFIYNAQQKEPLRLVTNTRFESPEGLIFKIKDSVVVPGYTVDASGKKTPGVMNAEVYADQVGETYNIAPAKFTVPGFKGEPEYQNIFAESTDSMSGGFNGKKFIIDEAELQTAQQALRTELRNSLLTRIASEKPAGFVVFDDSVAFTYQSLPSVEYGENLATIKEKVYLRVPLFKAEAFAEFVAQATVPGYEKEPVRIADYTALIFKYKSASTSALDINALEKIEFNLTGVPQIIWNYDAEKLKSELLNANKSSLASVLGGYSAIESATAVIRPFWKTKFPTDIEEIKIIEILKTDQ